MTRNARRALYVSPTIDQIRSAMRMSPKERHRAFPGAIDSRGRLYASECRLLKRAVEKYGRKNRVDTRELMQILDGFPGTPPRRYKKQARGQVTSVMNNERVATTGGRCV